MIGGEKSPGPIGPRAISLREKMMDRTWLQLLACPECRNHPLRIIAPGPEGLMPQSGELRCSRCSRSYPIIGGVPVLLPDSLRYPERPGKVWRVWRHRLDNFIEWRRNQGNHCAVIEQQKAFRDSLYEDFFSFCGLLHCARGHILDIGCGDGVVGQWLGDGCTYIGIDPLPNPERSKQFRLVQGIGERLPFGDGLFDCVLVMQSMDHCHSPAFLLAEAQRVLKPGGSIHIQQLIGRQRRQLPWRKRWQGRVFALFGRSYRDPHDCKTHFFDANGLGRLLEGDFEHHQSRTVGNNQIFLQARKREFAEPMKKVFESSPMRPGMMDS